MGSSFLGAEKADYFGIGDLLTALMQNVIVADELEGVGDFDTLTCVGRVGIITLEEETEFVGV